METESSPPSRGEASEQDPAPARNEDQSRESVSGSDLMVMEDEFVELEQKKVEMSQILDQIHGISSSVIQFTLKWKEIEKHFTSTENLLMEKTMEVELKERSVMERIVELEKKEERVEERERNIALLEKSMTLRLEEQEKERKWYVEELERLSKFNDDKSCELERKEKEFDVRQSELIESRSEEAELVEDSLRKLEAKEKELSLLDETLREKENELEKKVDIFEAEKKAKAEKMELDSKLLELREQKLEEREKVLKLRELEKSTRQAETCNRCRGQMLAEKSSEADSHTRPPKRHKPLMEHMHGDEDKGTDPACVVSASASSPVQTNHEAHEGDTEKFVSTDGIDEDTEPSNCADAEFNDFGKTMSSFVVGQVWALYDPIDDMPRFYGRIKNINKRGLSLQVKWLEHKDEESVPVACGRFKFGIMGKQSYLAFSHEMHPTILFKDIDVNPREGETWALFRDWSKSWNNNPIQHKPPYRYDFVEVQLNFDKHQGVRVAYLQKVEGFLSVFKRAGLVSDMIPPNEMHKFSHRVPSFKMNGDEKEGVPAGSFELDPAAIPSSMLIAQT